MALDDVFSNEDEVHAMPHTFFSPGSDSDHESTVTHAPEPNPNKRPLTDDDFDWGHWTKVVNSEPPRPAPAKRPKYENQVEDAQQPNPGPSSPKPAYQDLETWKPPIFESSGVYPSSNQASSAATLKDSLGPSPQPNPNPNPNKGPLTGQDTDFDWDHWTKIVNSQAAAKKPKYENEVVSYAPPNGIDQTHEYKVTHVYVPQLSPGSSADSDFEYISLDDVPPLEPTSPNQIGQEYTRPEPGPSREPQHEVVNRPLPEVANRPLPEVVDRPLPGPEDEKIHQEPAPSPDSVALDSSLQPLPAEYYSRPVDPQAVAYGLKGKEKILESRRVSSISRDVGIVAQREYRSAERSHDPGE